MPSYKPNSQEIRKTGFNFQHSRDWLTKDNVNKALAMDAALVTQPNTTVPAMLLQFISPEVIKVLTAKRAANKVFGERKVGDWTMAYYQYQALESVGSTGPYADYGDGPSAGVNSEWFLRDQYVFQTTITYGDREADMASATKLDLIAGKQRAAADIIAIDSNRFYLNGVAGKRIYGLLNDPNLPAAISPNTVGSATTWVSKQSLTTGAATAIYNDVLKLFAQLQTQMGGLVDQNTAMKLILSPGRAVTMMSVTEFGVSAEEMVRKAMPNLTIETVPECAGASAEIMMLICTEAVGQSTGELAFGEKIRQGRLVPDTSSYRQKYASSTYGFIIKVPAAFATMSGI